MKMFFSVMNDQPPLNVCGSCFDLYVAGKHNTPTSKFIYKVDSLERNTPRDSNFKMDEPDYSKMTKGQMRILLTENNVIPPPGDLKKAELVKYCQDNIRAGGPRTPAAALIPSPYRQGVTDPRTGHSTGGSYHSGGHSDRHSPRHGRRVRDMSPDSARKSSSPRAAFHPGAGGSSRSPPKKKAFGANAIRGVDGEVVPPPPKRTLGAPKEGVSSPKKNVVGEKMSKLARLLFNN
jgi:hypothetical protein